MPGVAGVFGEVCGECEAAVTFADAVIIERIDQTEMMRCGIFVWSILCVDIKTLKCYYIFAGVIYIYKYIIKWYTIRIDTIRANLI